MTIILHQSNSKARHKLFNFCTNETNSRSFLKFSWITAICERRCNVSLQITSVLNKLIEWMFLNFWRLTLIVYSTKLTLCLCLIKKKRTHISKKPKFSIIFYNRMHFISHQMLTFTFMYTYENFIQHIPKSHLIFGCT